MYFTRNGLKIFRMTFCEIGKKDFLQICTQEMDGLLASFFLSIEEKKRKYELSIISSID